MALLQIRGLPDHLYQRLAHDAEKERRSLSQQAIATLAKALGEETDPKLRRRAALRRAAAIDSKRTSKLLDPAKLVREDRDR